MVIRTEAWKDSQGKLHLTQSLAERADLFQELYNGYMSKSNSSSLSIFIGYVLDNYILVRRNK